MPVFFKAVEAVILPYVSSTESGIIQLAYGLNTPIITTRVGGNVDLIEDKKTGLLVSPKNSKELAEAIIKFYNSKLEKKIKKEMLKNKKIFEWNKEKERKFLNL